MARLGGFAVQEYQDLVDLARICLRQARQAVRAEVSAELRMLAKEYQSRAATLDGGVQPDIGETE
jgi:hypothetical protein